MKKIEPRGKQILVIPDEKESNEMESGIVRPPSEEREKKAFGTVEAVGPEIKDVKKGDRVIYGVFAGEEISLKHSKKEVDYRLLFDEDVLAFIR